MDAEEEPGALALWRDDLTSVFCRAVMTTLYARHNHKPAVR